MQVDGAFRVTHPVIEVMNVRQDVGMGHHYAFRLAGRAARINESEYRVRVIHNFWRKIVSNFQWILIEDLLPRGPRGRDRQRGMTDQSTWSRISEHSVNFHRGKAGI